MRGNLDCLLFFFGEVFSSKAKTRIVCVRKPIRIFCCFIQNQMKFFYSPILDANWGNQMVGQIDRLQLNAIQRWWNEARIHFEAHKKKKSNEWMKCRFTRFVLPDFVVDPQRISFMFLNVSEAKKTRTSKKKNCWMKRFHFLHCLKPKFLRSSDRHTNNIDTSRNVSLLWQQQQNELHGMF